MKYIKAFENHNKEFFPVPETEDRLKQVKNEYTIKNNPSIPDYKRAADEAIMNFKKTFNIFKDMVVLWSNRSKKEQHAVGEYIKTTSLNGIPIILLHEGTIRNLANKGGYTNEKIKEIIQTTVYHELFHALVDVDSAYSFGSNSNILKFQDEEIFVDDLAYMLYKGKKLPPNIMRVANMFRGKQWKGFDKNYK